MDDVSSSISEDLKVLALGPCTNATRFSAYNVNGFKFRTLDREQGLKTQNSGVFLISTTKCVSSSGDKNGQDANIPYYGKLVDIIELNYYGKYVTLFKCDWADTTRERGLRKDIWGFNTINFSKLIHTGEKEEHEPYIYASQAQMVYYVKDELDNDWTVAVHLKPRDLYDMGEDGQDDGDGVYENELHIEQDLGTFFDIDFENIQLTRDNIDDELENMDDIETRNVFD